MNLSGVAQTSARKSSVRSFLALQLLIWGTYASIHYAASLPAILDAERPVIAVAKVVRAITGLILSSAMWPLISTRIDPERKRWWVVIAATAFAAGWAWTFLDRVALVSIAAAAGFEIPWERFPRGMDLDYFFVMLAWTAGAAGIILAGRARSQNEKLLEQQLAAESARLHMLASQLNPHFLFNALNTIRSIAAEDAQRTREVVARLSAFLRRVLSFDPSELTTLEEELALAQDYLEVERARFETTLSIEMSIAPDTGMALVPPLLLQPILENAVKHGAADLDGVRRILVTTVIDGTSLKISVANRGSLRTGSKGMGLDLTATRLRQMFGTRGNVKVDQSGDIVTVTITIADVPMKQTSR